MSMLMGCSENRSNGRSHTVDAYLGCEQRSHDAAHLLITFHETIHEVLRFGGN